MVFSSVLDILRTWLPYTAKYEESIDREDPQHSELLREPWLEHIAANPDITPVLGAARMLAKNCMLPDDHLFKALLKTGLVEDMLFLYDGERLEAHLVIKLGRDVCGHEKIVHGGLTSSICDETYGALVYAMKAADKLGPAPAVTANLSINYRKPIPRHACLLCTSKLTKHEGRKLYMEATVFDGPSGTVYAESTSLFILMKTDTVEASNANSKA